MPDVERRRHDSDVVSIRARHECRAMLPAAVGDARHVLVSIRARHECRAMPGAEKESRGLNAVSIRARHECRAMPTWSPASSTGISFQSAPGMSAGRCLNAQNVDRDNIRFNPRPA